MDCASDYAFAAFTGTVLALLVIWVLTGRTDELRRGVRALFNSNDTVETYAAPKLSDYSGRHDFIDEENE